MDINPQGVLSCWDFAEKSLRGKGGSAVPSAPTFPAPIAFSFVTIVTKRRILRFSPPCLKNGRIGLRLRALDCVDDRLVGPVAFGLEDPRLPFVVLTTITGSVNKKRGIDHHCRRSQVLGGTRIFANFVDAYPCGLGISTVGVNQILTTAPSTYLPTNQKILFHAKTSPSLTRVPTGGT